MLGNLFPSMHVFCYILFIEFGRLGNWKFLKILRLKYSELRYCINSAALQFITMNKIKEEGYGEYLDKLK